MYADFRDESDFEGSFEKLVKSILPNDFIASIRKVIEDNLTFELDAYKNIPNYHKASEKLVPLYTNNSTVLGRIMQLLERHKKRKWILSNTDNPSIANINNYELQKIDNLKAHVKTNEYWYLQWFDLDTENYAYIYNETQDHEYVLTYDMNARRWLIESHYYPSPGQEDKVLPLLDPNIEFKFDKVEEFVTYVSSLLEKNGIELALLVLVKYSKELTLKEETYLKIKNIQRIYFESRRLRNLDFISHPDFKESKTKATAELTKILLGM